MKRKTSLGYWRAMEGGLGVVVVVVVVVDVVVDIVGIVMVAGVVCS